MHAGSQSILNSLAYFSVKFTKLANNFVYLIERNFIVASVKVFIKVMRHKMSIFFI